MPGLTYVYCWNQVLVMYTMDKCKVVTACPICHNTLTKHFTPQNDNIPFSGL